MSVTVFINCHIRLEVSMKIGRECVVKSGDTNDINSKLNTLLDVFWKE